LRKAAFRARIDGKKAVNSKFFAKSGFPRTELPAKKPEIQDFFQKAAFQDRTPGKKAGNHS